jgi:hypothetical protein
MEASVVEQFQRRQVIEPRHSPAYVGQIGREWRIVVPIRGKLCPKVATPAFLEREAAELWLHSPDGQQAVMRLRERPQRAPLIGISGAGCAVGKPATLALGGAM